MIIKNYYIYLLPKLLKITIMKKFFTFILVLTVSLNAFAQTKEPAPDFTGTDIHGNEINLYEILNGGQYVLIDFFFTTCGPCQTVTPIIEESYHNFGCNEHDVFYMEISPTDDNSNLENWVNNYSIEYPTIGIDGNGANICNAYGMQYYPTIILISPEKQIVIPDLWPINNTQTIIDALEAKGVEQHECTSSIEDENSESFSVFPNPAQDYFSVQSKNAKEIEVYRLTGQLVQKYNVTDDLMNISTENYSAGLYFVKIKTTDGKVKQLKLTVAH